MTSSPVLLAPMVPRAVSCAETWFGKEDVPFWLRQQSSHTSKLHWSHPYSASPSLTEALHLSQKKPFLVVLYLTSTAPPGRTRAAGAVVQGGRQQQRACESCACVRPGTWHACRCQQEQRDPGCNTTNLVRVGSGRGIGTASPLACVRTKDTQATQRMVGGRGPMRVLQRARTVHVRAVHARRGGHLDALARRPCPARL